MDKCQLCNRKSTGNENIVDGIVMCDYCHAVIMNYKELTREPVQLKLPFGD